MPELSAPAGKADLDLLDLYRALRLPRAIEEKKLNLIRQGRLSRWISGYGRQVVAVGCACALRPTDWILPLHRHLGVWTTREVNLERLFRQLMGREGGYTRGRDRTFHFGLPDKYIVGMSSHQGAMGPVACGLGLAARLKGSDRIVLSLIGAGATREGDFHEGLSLASAWKLPVIFVVENNLSELSVPASGVLPGADVADCAPGYGMPGRIVDGNDVLAVIEAVEQGADYIRSGRGPVLLEMKTFRGRVHEQASGTADVPAALVETGTGPDPIARFRQRLEASGRIDSARLDAIDRKTESEVEHAAERALAAGPVSSTLELEVTDVFAPALQPRTARGPREEKRLIDAIAEALRQALENDDRVLLMGRDIAESGGAFRVTRGFVEQFGRDRVRNTPIPESGAVGAALGLALEGFRPIVELQYADSISCGFNQIINNLATTHYRWGAPVNVTLRALCGGGIGAGPFHSQSPEAWFCHAPGLKVVFPSSPEDAKGLLLAAIEDPNPVLFLEHKLLYRTERGAVTRTPFQVPIGQARVVREGSDATIVTYGIGVRWALEEANHQQERGHSVEIIDLRSLVPWDAALVLGSVRKTSRLLVLQEAWLTAGFASEVASTVALEAFEWLDAPPVRVGGLDTPIPFSKNIEAEIFSGRSRLRAELEGLLAF